MHERTYTWNIANVDNYEDTEILYIILHNLFERDQENPVNVYIKKYSTFLNYVILYFVLFVTYIYTVVYHFKYTTAYFNNNKLTLYLYWSIQNINLTN